MFNVKQSSEVGPEISKSGESTVYTFWLELRVWGHEAPNLVALTLATGLFAVGAANRSEATGGSANGSPSNCATFGVASWMKPWTVPIVVFILKEPMDVPSSRTDEMTSKDRRLLRPPKIRK